MLTLPPEVEAANADLIALVDELVAHHGSERSELIPILQDLRSREHEISDLAMQLVADRLHLTPVEVQGVVSFYAFLRTERTGDHVVHLCRTLSCELAGMREAAEALREALGVDFGQTTADGLVNLEWANCIGLCDTPPAMLVDREAVGHVTPQVVTRVVAGLRGSR